MGRHNKRPTRDGNVVDQDHVDDSKISDEAVARLGLNNMVCYDCNANNAAHADMCRKCGGPLRRKAGDYRDA